jgi:dephospho-CoA kinase
MRWSHAISYHASGYRSGVHLFGLTGGIASGKSTVAARFRARGLPVVDADTLAREVVVPGSAASHEIREASDLKARGEPRACYEAALLVENGLAGAFTPLVVVAAPEASQVTRAIQRDGASVAEVEARVRAQMPLAAKVAVATIVIHNDASLDTLRSRADAALADICARVGVSIDRYPIPTGELS